MSGLGIGEKVAHCYAKVIIWLLGIAAVIAFFIMLLITADVFGRDLFSRPLQGTFQLSKTLLVIVVSLSFAYVQAKRANIELEFLTKHFSPLWQAVVDTFALTLGLAFFGLIFVGAFQWSIETWRTAEYMEGDAAFPYWPSRFALTLGAFVVTVTYVIQIIVKSQRVISLMKSIDQERKEG